MQSGSLTEVLEALYWHGIFRIGSLTGGRRIILHAEAKSRVSEIALASNIPAFQRNGERVLWKIAEEVFAGI